MRDTAVKITYSGHRLNSKDFVPGALIDGEAIICDVVALVQPSDSSIDVEIIKVLIQPGDQNLAGLLRLDTEYRMKPLMRSLYLNMAREGHEGEAPSEEIA